MDTGPARSRPDPLPRAARTGGTGGGDAPRRPRPPSDPDLLNDWHEMGSTRILPEPVSLTKGETELLPDDTANPTPWEEGREGDSIIGGFRLLKKLGEGAMGAVYKAYQTEFDRTVALKVLFKQVADNPKLVERMYREGRIMGQLDHPNIICGYGVGEDKGWHYIAMEYIDGENLQKVLARVGKISLGDALHITLVCARALQYAHELDLIHRDIKPDNILITRDGQIKVADLGMVKIVDADLSLTQTGHAVGTPWYMPLEQAKNAKDADARSDIYALGCTLYCMLTGAPPFTGKTIFDVLKAKEAASFPAARNVNPEVPDKLDLIIDKMTAKQAKYRYQSCAEVIHDLESLDLVNEDLEFLHRDNPKPAKQSAPAAPRTMAAPAVVTNIVETEAPKDRWYVRFKNEAGQVIIKKMKTAEVLELIADPNFDPSAKASRTKTEGYRALATYKEFTHILLGRVSKSGADNQSSRFRNVFKKIEREEEIDHRAAAGAGNSALRTTLDYWLRIFGRLAGVSVVVCFVGYILYLLGNKAVNLIFDWAK